MASPTDPLRLFDPVIARWFKQTVGEPTEVQRLAWPVIAAGDHALVTAPTGSGKTLAAFLWALDRLLSRDWEGGGIRVLYVSPLRALGNDVRRNLLSPLADLQRLFAEADAPGPLVRVMSRTGDTSQAERRQIQKSPPEILITTPETLNIMVTSAGGQRLLGGLRTVILDEIHAVFGSKRGVLLMSAVERLVPLSGELQRIALSATVHPREMVARWVGGHVIEPSSSGSLLRPRPVTTVAAATPKTYDIGVSIPLADPGASRDPDSLWAELTRRLKRTVRGNRSTLIFGNSKRVVEKVARFLNEDEPSQVAYSHHGALSREIRAVVEERLKEGRLKAIVATNSLELGIDIGAIDEVAMVQPPPSVTSTVQRLGRSGHGVGETSRGRLYPLHGHALLESAVLVRAVLDGDLEPARPVTNPLDVLAQVVLSMTVRQRWTTDGLFDAVRACDAFRHLPRSQFDLVLQMLAGRYATTKLRSLRPLISIDGVDDTVTARPGAERLIYLSGGTIPDRGYFTLRVEGSGSPLGQLDEEFVWERSVGDTFTLGVQTWRVQRITHNDVFVSHADARSAMAPFWRAEERDRSSFLSERIGRFLEHALPRFEHDAFVDDLVREFHLEANAAAELRRLLAEQVAATGTLPHRHQVVVEHTVGAGNRAGHRQMVLHTVWGGRVNRPFGYALATAWKAAHGSRPEIIHEDDCLVITHPADQAPDDPFALVPPDRIEDLLRPSLESTGFFGARFREAAGRSLLLPRGGGRRRTPLWLNRQRAKELLDIVSEHGDFPLVLEAWRECLQDEFELEVLRDRLVEVADGRIAVRHVHTDTPSPFTAQVAWRQTNTLMYEDDAPSARGAGRLRADLVRELALSSHLRPRIPGRLGRELQAKIQRTAPGYAPRDHLDLLDWTRERLMIPDEEWGELLAAMERDHGLAPADALAGVASRVAAWRPRGREGPTLVCAVENIPVLAGAFALAIETEHLRSASLDDRPARQAITAFRAMTGERIAETSDRDPAELLAEWLAFYGPVNRDFIARVLPVDPTEIDRAIEELAGEEVLVVDQITDDSDAVQICDRQNLERLLRMARAAARPSLRPRPAELLPLFLARHQGLATSHPTLEDLKQALESLIGWSAPVDLVETELLPARIAGYQPQWLDTLLAETDLEWFGCGDRKVSFGLSGDRDLLTPPDPTTGPTTIDEIFPTSIGRYTLTELLRHSGLESSALVERLWEGVWAGAVSADTFAPVRHGSATGFKAEPVAGDGPRHGRRRPRFDRWKSRLQVIGAWRRLPPGDPPLDALDTEEDDRQRARLVLDRYGVMFRELAERELPALRWGALFRSLRMLELGGEVVAGRFFDGVPGLQFMSLPALRALQDGLAEDQVWWLNAVDPASPCGLGAVDLGMDLPRRVPSNHLVFHGRRLVLVSERRSAVLAIRVRPDHPHLADYLEFLKVQLGRVVRPRRSITVETINDDPATTSPYRNALQKLFHLTRTPTSLKISRLY